MLPGRENTVIAAAVASLLLSCVQIQIYAITYPLPVTGHHMCFLTSPDFATYSRARPVMLPDPENIGAAVRISLPSCIQVEIYE